MEAVTELQHTTARRWKHSWSPQCDRKGIGMSRESSTVHVCTSQVNKHRGRYTQTKIQLLHRYETTGRKSHVTDNRTTSLKGKEQMNWEEPTNKSRRTRHDAEAEAYKQITRLTNKPAMPRISVRDTPNTYQHPDKRAHEHRQTQIWQKV